MQDVRRSWDACKRMMAYSRNRHAWIDLTHQHCIMSVYIICGQPGGGGRRYPEPTFSRVLWIIRITFSDETNVKVTPQKAPSDLTFFPGLLIFRMGLGMSLPVTLRAYAMYCLVFYPAPTNLHPTFSRVLCINNNIHEMLFCGCVPLYWSNP